MMEPLLPDQRGGVWESGKELGTPLPAAATVGGTLGGTSTPAIGTPTGTPQAQSSPLTAQAPLDVGSTAVVAAQAKAQGKSDKEIEEMITLYHISNAPGWAERLAGSKAGGKGFDDLGGLKINPDITMNKRK